MLKSSCHRVDHIAHSGHGGRFLFPRLLELLILLCLLPLPCFKGADSFPVAKHPFTSFPVCSASAQWSQLRRPLQIGQ